MRVDAYDSSGHDNESTNPQDMYSWQRTFLLFVPFCQFAVDLVIRNNCCLGENSSDSRLLTLGPRISDVTFSAGEAGVDHVYSVETKKYAQGCDFMSFLSLVVR